MARETFRSEFVATVNILNPLQMGSCFCDTESELGLNSLESSALAVEAGEPLAACVSSGRGCVCDMGAAIPSAVFLDDKLNQNCSS